MIQDPAVLGYLGRALSLELSAVQQYLSLARWLEMRGMSQIAQRFRDEAQEELQHVDRIIGRMLALGVAPNASQCRPVRLDGSLSELMEYLAGFELEIVGFYQQAVNHCLRLNDHENRMFFELLLQEERQHAIGIEAWRQELITGQVSVTDLK